MAETFFDQEILGAGEPDTSARQKLAPTAPTGATNQSQPNREVAIVQQFLLDHGLPIAKNKRQVPDGGWGPVSNQSLADFITTFTQPTAAPEYRKLVEQLRSGWSPNPKETLQNIGQLAELVGSFQAQVEVAQQGQKPQQQSGTYFVDVVGPNGTVQFPVHEEVFQSAEALEGAILYTDLVDRNSSGQERAAQLHQAIKAVDAAIVALDPKNPGRFQATRSKLQQFDGQLVGKYTRQGPRMVAADYIRQNYAAELAGISPEVAQSIVNQLVANLQGERIVDNNGYIRDDVGMRDRRQLIRELITQWKERYGAGGRRGR